MLHEDINNKLNKDNVLKNQKKAVVIIFILFYITFLINSDESTDQNDLNSYIKITIQSEGDLYVNKEFIKELKVDDEYLITDIKLSIVVCFSK